MKTLRLLTAVLFLLVVSAAGSRAQNCQAWFMYTVDTTVSPNVVTLMDSSWAGPGAVTSWQWTYNGSPVGTNAPNQTLNINVQQWDFICLTITTDSGCVSTWCDTVFLSPPCLGSVTYSWFADSLGTHHFTPSTMGITTPVSYYWFASNGATSTQATFVTAFNQVGAYNVCLHVTDANGCSYLYCDTINVTTASGCQGCTPNVYYTIDSLNPQMYTFYDTTTYINTPTTANWLLNNVMVGSGSSVTLTLPQPGTTYQLCRTVNVTGCPGSCPHSHCMTVVTPQTPGIHISYFDGDSSQVYCTAPQFVNMYVYGTIHGYPPGTPYIVHVNFDDGTDTTYQDSASSQSFFYTNFTHGFLNPGTYNPQIIVYSIDSAYSDTMVIQHPIIITGACAPVTGYVYLDNNANCVFDGGDVPLAHRGVYLSNGSSIYRYTYTDSTGFYSFNVPTGQTYTVHVNSAGNWYSGGYTVLCPAGGSLTVSSIPSSNNNFFLYCPSTFDLSLQLSGWRFVPGQTGSICVYPHNLGCATPNGTVQLVLDPLLTIVPDSNSTYSVSGDTVTWSITPSNGYYQSLCVHVMTATTATLGDTVCVTATILPIVGDSIPSNNTSTRCWAVRTSWDPNDKTAQPEGAGVNHAIRPEQELTYTIRFQNTGTAAAQNVYILDPLDANLDINTLEVLATSHPMVPSVLTGNVLRFTYDNINLVDSNENEPLSHGYVTYRISPVAGIANGTVIHNTASIYFDYNPAVVTNTTMHSIDIFLSVNQPHLQSDLVSIYPNPASDRLFVELKKTGRAEVKLYDATGRLVLHSTLQASGTVDVQGLQSGSYTVQVMQNEAVQNAAIILLK